jgi:DNA mismatch repair protein MutS2
LLPQRRNDVNPENIRADKLLDDIRKERNRAGREREKIEKARKRNEELNRELEQRLETIEDERRKVIAEARAEAELEVAVLRRNIDSLKSQLKKARQPLEALKKVEEKVEEIAEKVEEPVVRKVKEERRPAGVLKLGDKVTVSTLNADGVVTALGESDAEVQVGSLRIRAKLSELRRKQSIIESLPKEAPKTAETTTVQRHPLNSVLPAWNSTCAGRSRKTRWTSSTAISNRLIFRDCLLCASSTARGQVCCARWCATRCARTCT